MFNKVSLGIRGDLNLFKKHISQCSVPGHQILFNSPQNKDELCVIEFVLNNDLKLLDKVLNTLSEYIIERYEQQFINRILSEEYTYLSPKQKREIISSISTISDDPVLGYRPRKQAVLLSLYDYLREDSFMLLDGFVAFRLKEYETLLGAAIKQLVEECITRHEYENFISLLKYFVNIQEPRPKLTHIYVLPDGRYELFSEQGENITKKCLSDFVDTDDIPENANFDDLLISMLITLAPKNIVVHNHKEIKNKELFTTITRVFDDKMLNCDGCSLCTKKPVLTTV